MAEIVVNFAVNKLCDAALQATFSLYGVEGKVERMKRELIRIQCFLKDADRKRGGDERVKNWVKELREVSHWIEDTIDLFAMEIEESSREYAESEKPSKKVKIESWFPKPEKVSHIHKFGKEIDKILARIDEIAASREKYGIENLIGSDKTAVAGPIIPDLDETELVGFEDEKEKIVQELLDRKCVRRMVVSIVGTGGLGKSTLAAEAYSSDVVKSKFDLRVWLSISQNYTPTHLLKTMIKEITGSEVSIDDKEYLIKKVNKTLREKKYLIVMDDVWSEDLWPQISSALPDVENGSRVLITSRFLNVPIAADPGSQPNKLRFLSEEESLKLLLRTALRNRVVTDGFIADISDLTKILAQKCNGLPLALVVLGGLLSRKQLTYHAWENVSRNMVWSEQGKRCMDVLTTSYDDMSSELKSCFMYLSCFPEDYKIDAQELIRLWVAEGLVPHISSRILLEDTAEDYLEQLVQRSMVQVLKRSPWGSIEKCGLHDLIRDLAIQKAQEVNFLASCSSTDEEKSYGVARRVAVHHKDCEVMKHVSSNLRSFLNFNCRMQNLSGHRLLQVLHIDDRWEDCSAMERYDKLTQLRYIKLASRCLAQNSQQQYFFKLLGSLKYLQTLDAAFIEPIPDCIWHLKTLRHVILRNSKPGPPPSVDLKFLQTLSGVEVPESWQSTALPNLPNLRVIGVHKIKSSSWELFVAFLHRLKHLEHLSILHSDHIPHEFIDMRPFHFYHLLKSLSLNSCKFSSDDMQFEAAMFPTHLTKLSLVGTCTTQHLMPELEKLQGLKNLFFYGYRYKTKKLRCTARGFPHLEDLYINLLDGVEWVIEEGAMPVLKNLIIKRHSPSRVIHGLENLTTLRNLKWAGRFGDNAAN